MKDYIVEREFEHAGYKCVVLFSRMGHRCGYVGIPKEHPLYREDHTGHLDMTMKDLQDMEIGKRSTISLLGQAFDDTDKVRLETYFDVHGSLTYSGGGENSEYPIESNLWWFGFDCAHYQDGKDLQLAYEKFPQHRESIKRMVEIEQMYPIDDVVLRTEEYVADECKRLAEQLKEFEKETSNGI